MSIAPSVIKQQHFTTKTTFRNHNDVEKAEAAPAAPVSKWAALRNAPDAAEEGSGESAAKPNPWVKLLDKNSELQGEGDPSHQGPTTALARSRSVYHLMFHRLKVYL